VRLTDEQVSLFKNQLSKLSQRAKIYLFGSRVDDSKKGGDIDLLIVADDITKRDIRKVRVAFFKKFGEQKLDILLDDGSFSNPFHKLVLQKAVLL